MARSKKKKPLRTDLLADVSHGAEWLHQLTESQFRDEILKDLFTEMKKHGVIADHLHTHGPREHGVDWIVLEKGGLSQRYVGIQAKSQALVRQGSSGRESALAVKQQCMSAFEHTFNWHGATIRLDVVELWMSAPITTDAIDEFSAPLGRRISVKPSEGVFSLIEQYCPKAISKIPGLAEAGYIKKMAEPDSLSIRVLGVPLNPRNHFLEPKFSRYPGLSLDRILDQRTKKVREERALFLEDIIDSGNNAIVVGGELSGKSYILKRASCLLAQNNQIPVLLDAAQISATGLVDALRILKENLPWYSATRMESAEKGGKPLVLLVDNADVLTDEQIGQLHDSGHGRIQIILAGKKSRTVPRFTEYYIAGVRSGAIQRFVRSLDIERGAAAALMDRAVKYLDRTIGISGLPVNPFTVSVMLEECSVSGRRLATPTMGRLIERFVLGQLGSHSDTARVDYETKDQFLTQLGGKHTNAFALPQFRRRLALFIAAHGHAHTTEDLEQDLVESGLLEIEPMEEVLRWSHPIFRDFFWVRNLIRERKYRILAGILQTREAPAIAAIAGSQLGNAHEVFIRLLKVLSQQEWADASKSLPTIMKSGEEKVALLSDADEEELLAKIEVEAGVTREEGRPVVKRSTTEQELATGDETFRKEVSIFAARYVEEKHSLISNLSSLLLNARALTREDKLDGVLCVIRSNVRVSRYFSEILQNLKGRHVSEFQAGLCSRFIGLTINDGMIGDGFLAQVLKELYRKARTADEKLFVVDVLVASGAVSPSNYLNVLKENKDLADTVAVYLRLVSLYYYRHHKDSEKRELKEAMKEVRRQAKGIRLAPVS